MLDPLIPFALLIVVMLTLCFAAIPPRVSPDLTLYFATLVLFVGVASPSEYLPDAPGIVSVCPDRIKDPLIPFALLISEELTLCLAAIAPIVSPDLTLYFAVYVAFFLDEA